MMVRGRATTATSITTADIATRRVGTDATSIATISRE